MIFPSCHCEECLPAVGRKRRNQSGSLAVTIEVERRFDQERKEKILYKKYLLNTAQLCWADENRFAKR